MLESVVGRDFLPRGSGESHSLSYYVLVISLTKIKKNFSLFHDISLAI